ncbi:MAG: M42 family peptidase [Clostridia bacterium]|nr:M42 family peptidase [Clostridia bacterium]
MIDLKETLFLLSNADGVGDLKEASDLAYNLLSKYCECTKTDNLTVIGFMKGESDYTLMLDAHIDQVGFVVTSVDDKGFLTVKNIGGIDIRALPSRRVTVHGKEKITAVFSATPPHLAKGEVTYDDIESIKLDTAIGSKAKEIVSVGDYVTFANTPKELFNNRVCSRSFDNRAAVTCLIAVAEMLRGKKLPFNLAFVLSDGEELGLRGIRAATFKIDPNEAIAVDVSFGDGIGIDSEDCSPLGSGAMIGVAPTLDSKISKRLMNICESKNIPYTTEVMDGKTGTNADMISVNKEGVRTCTVSIPLRNMHSDAEIVDLSDLESVCQCLCEYILAGGVKDV